MRHEAAGITTDQFPKQIRIGAADDARIFALEYHFAPGDARDGVTVIVPLDLLAELDPVPLEWLVPGMLKEKVQGLLKSLPQKIRRHCVPIPDYAADFCARWSDKAGQSALIPALIQDISQKTGIAAKRDDFKLDGLSPHCRANIRVIDSHGRRLAEGRDIELLREALGVVPSHEVGAAGQPTKEQWLDRFALSVKEPLKALEKELHSRRDIGLQFTPFGGHEQLMDQIRTVTLSRAFLANGLPGSDAEFEALLTKGRSRVLLLGQEVLRQAAAILAEYTVAQKKLPTIRGFSTTTSDIEQQFSRLMPKNFLVATPPERAGHLPRYLKAIAVRIDKCRTDPARDQRWQKECQSVEAGFWRWAAQNRGAWPERMVEFRWMLEELRVSLFAQELKTPIPISVKRLQKSWASLQE
jgi:ATP-dependent helicase HrpA